MKEQLNRVFQIKNNRGLISQVTREHYLRDDIPCYSRVCSSCPAEGLTNLLPKGVDFYVLPTFQAFNDYLEVFEEGTANNFIKNVVILQSVLANISFHGKQQRGKLRIREMMKNASSATAVFSDLNSKHTYVNKKSGPTDTEQLITSAKWYAEHLQNKVQIILLTSTSEEADLINAMIDSTIYKSKALSFGDYLKKFNSNATSLLELHQSLSESLLIETPNDKGTDLKLYENYWPTSMVDAEVKKGNAFVGTIHINKYKSMQEATVKNYSGDTSASEGRQEILIIGMKNRNRAIQGDKVCVEILPQEFWVSQNQDTIEYENDEDIEIKDELVQHDRRINSANLIKTGRIVSIVETNRKAYVCCVQPDDRSYDSVKSCYIICVPADRRIPKIRLNTHQAEVLVKSRFIVRIDGWDQNSRYPRGHFVKSLGCIGDIEAETASLLVEYDISVPHFSERAVKELPTDTIDYPWTIDENEVKKRRDLRDSHFIVSIDPIGCQDVDDALSAVPLRDGGVELGVHIADVSHFVTEGMFVDQEARARGTTVYLPDRRYDMLPSVLSEKLCSLREGVDRYAFSVLWTLNKNLEVKRVWFGKTVIRSSYECPYEMAQNIFDGKQSLEEIRDQHKLLKEMSSAKAQNEVNLLRERITLLIQIGRKLKKDRLQDGAVELESEEVKFKIGEKVVSASGEINYKVDDVIPKKKLEIHETIAECMIKANSFVAETMVKFYPSSALLRQHGNPRPDNFATLLEFAKKKGFNVDVSSNKRLAQSLSQCVDPKEPLYNSILRSLATLAMNEALYISSNEVSVSDYYHYGLALSYYTHFTSPIRRYSDIVVHRLLAACADCNKGRTNDKVIMDAEKPPIQGAHVMTPRQVTDLCVHLNEKHRNSKHAQMKAAEIYRCLYFKTKGRLRTTAIITAIKKNGLMIFIPRYQFNASIILIDRHGNPQVLRYLFSPAHGNPGGRGRPENEKNETDIESLSLAENCSVKITETSVSCKYKGKIIEMALFSHIDIFIDIKESRAHGDSVKISLIGTGRHMERHLNRNEQVNVVKSILDENSKKNNDLKGEVSYQQSKKSIYDITDHFFNMSLNS